MESRGRQDKIKTVQFDGENDQEESNDIALKEGYVDGQLSFKIRKTKNSENIKAGLRTFKSQRQLGAISSKQQNAQMSSQEMQFYDQPTPGNKKSLKQQQLLLRHKQQQMKEKEDTTAKDNGSLQFLNQIIKPQAFANEKQKITQAKKLVRDIEKTQNASGVNKFEQNSLENAFNEVLMVPVQKSLDDLKIQQEQFKRDVDLLKSKHVFLRQNQHADRDPDITLKFKDGGRKILEDIGIDNEMNDYEMQRLEEEQKQSTQDKFDIMRQINTQYNQSKTVPVTQTPSPFSRQLSVQVPEYFGLMDKIVPGGFALKGMAQNQMSKFQDMQMKARSGIKVGDIQREAHMAFCMALIQEDRGKYDTAVKFLKRLYFCAKLLDDFEGAEIAINKIGICYYMKDDFEQSLNFHCKHQELLNQKKTLVHSGLIISLYNQAMCLRQLYLKNKATYPDHESNVIEQCLNLFNDSYKIAKEIQDREHQVLAKTQMGILHMLKDTKIFDLNTAEEYFQKSVNETINDGKLKSPQKSRSKSKSPVRSSKEVEQLNPRNIAKSIVDKFPFKNQRMLIDMMICLAYIHFEWQEWKQSKQHFDQAGDMCKKIGEIGLRDMCLCNQGVAKANLAMDEIQGGCHAINQNELMMNTFYRTSGPTGDFRNTFTTGFGAGVSLAQQAPLDSERPSVSQFGASSFGQKSTFGGGGAQIAAQTSVENQSQEHDPAIIEIQNQHQNANTINDNNNNPPPYQFAFGAKDDDDEEAIGAFEEYDEEAQY